MFLQNGGKVHTICYLYSPQGKPGWFLQVYIESKLEYSKILLSPKKEVLIIDISKQCTSGCLYLYSLSHIYVDE